VGYGNGWPHTCKLVKRLTATLIFCQGVGVGARGGQVVDFDGGELRLGVTGHCLLVLGMDW
jgi:hypothetical protein